MSDEFSRRHLLASIGSTAVVAAGIPLAGCSGQSAEGAPTETQTQTEASTTESSGGGGDWTKTDTVEMTDELTFEPAQIEVSKGTTVTWENVGAIGHSVTAYEGEIPESAAYFASGEFDSEDAARDAYPEGDIPEGEAYEHTFETTGTFEYFCIPHEMNGMVGKIKVV
jgi:plastocyanin